MRVCSKCGKEVMEQDARCRDCQKTIFRKFIWVGAIEVFVIVAVAVLVEVLLGGNKTITVATVSGALGGQAMLAVVVLCITWWIMNKRAPEAVEREEDETTRKE